MPRLCGRTTYLRTSGVPRGMRYLRFYFLTTLRLPRTVLNVSKTPLSIVSTGPNLRIDFVDQSGIVEQVNICQDASAQLLSAKLESTIAALEEYRATVSGSNRSLGRYPSRDLSANEFKLTTELASPIVVATAARLRSTISFAPFVADSPASVAQPAPESLLWYVDPSFLGESELESLLESNSWLLSDEHPL